MASTLKDRFFCAMQPFVGLLNLLGVHLRPCPEFNKREILFLRVCSCFWLLVNLQSQFHTFLRRTPFQDLFNSNASFVETLNHVGFRMASFFCDMLGHILLLFAIIPTVDSVIHTLEAVDSQLGRPSLSRVKKCSVLATGWIIITVFLFALHLNHIFYVLKVIF